MRYAIALVLVGAGCSSFFPMAKTPGGEPVIIELHRHIVRYRLLAQTSAEACANIDEVKRSNVKTKDPRLVGSPLLYEQAKFDALTKIDEADGLVGVRVKVDYRNGQECVTVVGRGYRITSMMAAPASPPPSAPIESPPQE